MNKKILLSVILTALLVFSGALLRVDPEPSAAAAIARLEKKPTQSDAQAARVAAIPDGKYAHPRAGQRIRTQPGAGLPSRQAAADIFPDSVPPSGDWRNQHPAILRVMPYAGVAVTFSQVQVKEDGRHLTWIGRNPELPGAAFVGVATPEGYDAVMLMPGAGQYNFHVRDGLVLVEEVAASGADCELIPGAVAVQLPVPSGVHYAEAGNVPSQANPGDIATISPVNAPRTVDVLFLYNTRALAVAASRSGDPVGYIDGYARAGLEICNQVLVNSRVTEFTWRYIGLVAAPEYPEKATVSEDLAMIAPDGPLDSFVRAVRAEYGADQVLMWVGAGTRQGSAFAGDPRSAPVPVEYAVAGLRLTAGILILAHELAHNFGCHHDRGHAGTGDGSTATPDGDGLWCYGLLWNDPGAATTSGTVMAYADFLVPYFSNPAITLNITSTLENRPGPFLDLGIRTIGFPETDPRASNNARILQEHAAHMAALSEETEATPVILQQPQDTTLSAGQILALSVSAVGGGLSYQWLKDDVTIAGAVEASFSKTFAAGDAGNYRVRIVNHRGTVTSRAAVVTVAAATIPPVVPTPVAPAAASSGGGGGAPSWWFYGLLLVTALLRRGLRAGTLALKRPGC